MKKIFLLLAAACLLCCVSCKDKTQPAQESKNSPAYDAAMKVLDKAEKELNKAKTCEDLKRIEDYLDEENSKLTEKYGEDKNFTKKEREKIEDRGGSLYDKIREKSEKFGCYGGYDDSYNNYTGTAAFVAAMRIFDKVEQYIYQSNTCEDLEELDSKFDYEFEEWENTYDEDTDMSANEREQLKNRSNQLGNIIISKAKQLGCDGGYGNSGYDDYDDYDDYDY